MNMRFLSELQKAHRWACIGIILGMIITLVAEMATSTSAILIATFAGMILVLLSSLTAFALSGQRKQREIVDQKEYILTLRKIQTIKFTLMLFFITGVAGVVASLLLYAVPPHDSLFMDMCLLVSPLIYAGILLLLLPSMKTIMDARRKAGDNVSGFPHPGNDLLPQSLPSSDDGILSDNDDLP